ncbi:MAG: flagellar protein FliS [Ignavibacteria bacterium]|jgi:flagellar protein FliS
MYQTASYKNLANPANRANVYIVKEILEADQKKLLIKIYDFAILHAKKGNIEKANNALGQLIKALNFDLEETKEIAIGLLKLYQFCQDQIRKRESDIAVRILSDLRETWLMAFKQNPHL